MNALKLACLLAAVTLILPGCIKRKESITVKRDGAVRFHLTFDGDPADFAGGDALPEKSTGWSVKDEIKDRDDGKQDQIRTATLIVGPDEPLPDSFATPGTPEYETSLRFPTELTIERRRDGTYYHFRRTYEPRAFARYNIYQELMKDDLGDSLDGKAPEELTPEERRRLIESFRFVEMQKHIEYVNAGIAAVWDQWPQDYGLLLGAAVREHFESADIEPLLALLGEPQSDERDAEIDRFGKRILEGVPEVLEDQLARLPEARTRTDAFFEAYDLEEARQHVTQDLQDEQWSIEITMPGEIVAHNADEADGSTVSWKFPGKALNDRVQTIMVTSRVTREQRPRRNERP